MTYYDIDGNMINTNELYYIIGKEATTYNYNDVIELLRNDDTIKFINTTSNNYFICSECNCVQPMEELSSNGGGSCCDYCYAEYDQNDNFNNDDVTYYDILDNEIQHDRNYYILNRYREVKNYDEVIEILKDDDNIEVVAVDDYNAYYICADCGYVYRYNDYDHYTLCNGDDICDDCYCGGGYGVCADCGELFYDEDIVYNDNDDEYYCTSCNERHQRYIFEYHHHKGEEDFKSTNYDNTDLYFGVELEVYNACGCDNEHVASNIYNKHNDDVYFESDSSIGGGFEIISQPFTFNYWRDVLSNKYKDMCDYLISEGYKSNDTTTCGLHVHVSRKALGNTYEEINDNINKIVLFTEYFKDDIIKFARRGSTHYMQFLSDYLDGTYKNYDKLDYQSIKTIDVEKNIDRYLAVNVLNNNTIEFRIFKGTLKYSTIYATIEFLNNLIQVIKTTPLNKISFSKVINANKTIYLKDYIKERNIDIKRCYMRDSSITMQRLHNKRLKYLKLAYANINILLKDFNEFYNKKLMEFATSESDIMEKSHDIYIYISTIDNMLDKVKTFKRLYDNLIDIDYINDANINDIVYYFNSINAYLKNVDYTSNKLDILNKNIKALKEVR